MIVGLPTLLLYELLKKYERVKKMKKRKAMILAFVMALCVLMSNSVTVEANTMQTIDTGISQKVYAVGQYANWDGVSTVAQFVDQKGNFCFAFMKGKKINIVKTKDGKVKKKIKLKMKGNLFGDVICDGDGFYYAVTGKENSSDNRNMKTVFITKYDASGKLIKSVGNNGRSSLAYYYDDSYNTKVPFHGGNCEAAINGNYLAVNYAREMYSGHQSNSVWMIDKNTMQTVTPAEDYSNYESHSFGQRVVSYAGGFAFMSEGDCYNRAFTFSTADLQANTFSETPIFDFWVKKGTFDAYNMYVLNNNFAHIGDLCTLNDGKISFVASSVKAMGSKAEKQKEQIFIQIFDPNADLTKKSAYVTTGNRLGTAGKNGDETKTNYGVKWLTKYKSGSIRNPQAVTDGSGNTIVLFERYNGDNNYLGVYCTIVDSKGNITKKISRISKTAHLNSCETPVYCNGYMYWCGNNAGDYSEHKLEVYRFKIS